ncbi:MAG: anthranilate synthase component I family protein [Pirellulales bacterium]|nr:anthranilate synthase component I family protein [Pirellulales bacterium]
MPPPPPPLPLVERLDPNVPPVDLFRRLSALPHVVFFDSAMRHPTLGRYSFIAADPVEWFEWPPGNNLALAQLDDRLATLPRDHVPELPPFQGGWAGLFGYELAQSLERVPSAAFDEFQLPALALGLYDVVVAIDHCDRAAWLISQGWPHNDPQTRRQHAAARLAFFRSTLSSPHASLHAAHTVLPVRAPLPTDALARQFRIPGHEHLTSNFSKQAYLEAVQLAIDYIHAGDIFQVNLAQRLLHPAGSNAIDLYCRLRDRNPAPFAGFLDGGDWQLASASPERFIRIAGDHVETRPIKGTRGRAKRPEADLFAADELLASSKDRAENTMIVDLLRNDLSRTCQAGSVRVSQLCGLETYEYVQHLVSVVEGTIRRDATPLEVLRAAFPGGSVTGAPKIRAMQIIAQLEPTARGPYCGSLAYLGPGNQCDSNILIRTVTAARNWWQLPVGGGIVAQSSPQLEYDETWHKATGLLRALQT